MVFAHIDYEQPTGSLMSKLNKATTTANKILDIVFNFDVKKDSKF